MKVVVGCGCCLESLSSFRELKYQQTNSKLGKLWCGNEGLEGVSIGCVCRPFFFLFHCGSCGCGKTEPLAPPPQLQWGFVSRMIYISYSPLSIGRGRRRCNLCNPTQYTRRDAEAHTT